MAWAGVNDLDYLATRLHGRRARMAEAERVDGLCRLADIPELSRTLYPEAEFRTAVDLQRRLAQDLVDELSGMLKHLEGPGADLLSWMLVRFQVENLKVLLRGQARRMPLAVLERHVLRLPREWALDMPALAGADSVETFTARLPLGLLRKSLREALDTYREEPRLFFREGALDKSYFQELLARGERIPEDDQALIQSLLRQEVDMFHLALVVRGKFQYGIAAELLAPFHVPGSGISRERFAAMLAASELAAAAGLAVERALDALPAEPGAGEAKAAALPAALEAMAWSRFLRLSNRAFRRSHMGLGAIVGYVGIRRVQLANLITLSEGIADGMGRESLCARFIPRSDLEAANV